ncbi:HAD IIID h [Pyrrhoderma noxium]|uniref:HAD IIID h n=1 Tax=Pyrrhoderma noxium TaxID=2282107 RepID=A0A286UW30_9AGAM|nr:HAD IIID h [Pyrrhoderma noxium]
MLRPKNFSSVKPSNNDSKPCIVFAFFIHTHYFQKGLPLKQAPMQSIRIMRILKINPPQKSGSTSLLPTKVKLMQLGYQNQIGSTILKEDTIESLRLQNGKKFSLIGTPVGDEIKDPAQMELLPDIFNDLDIDFSRDPKASEAYIADRRNQRKIREATEMLRKNLTLMSPLREGKKLLVLDIDYTILDTKPLIEGALPPTECARPKLHEFLKAIYPFYDICIWSQTSWIWLETKLHELGMIGPEQTNYKINFVLDKTCMFKVFSKRNGQDFQHHVKPLKIIWNLFPQYNASNTIHVDDLGRNFALNPGEGLKIRAFKEAHTERALADRELVWLARYMIHVAAVPDLKKVDHKEWKKVVRAFDPPEEGQ